MQIIVPMSGFGERFRKAGYEIPKPLIAIEGKPIIRHVVEMFPGEKDFIFICNQEHLDDPSFSMKAILEEACPSGKIVGITPHKLGPVHAVLKVKDLIKDTEPVVVNYCDFSCYWNWDEFKEFIKHTECDGAIPSYRGFHPHSLGSTNYAYMLEEGGWVKDIQEKQPFTNNRMSEYASSGTYYFSSGEIMKNAFETQISKNLDLNNEYYVSLAYKVLLEDNKSIAVYPLQHFMQWGTPEDVDEYNKWSNVFKNINNPRSNPVNNIGTSIIPMAGLGKRFSDDGYKVTKPLIKVSGRSMVSQAVADLPVTSNYVFVLRNNMKDYESVIEELNALYPKAIIKTIDHETEGQACTAMIGIDAINEKNLNDINPITFGACDNGALYDLDKFNSILNDPSVDVIVWGARGYVNAQRNPEMYGWIDEDNNIINSISVKTPLQDPSTDPIVLGTFTFKRGNDFKKSLESLMKRNGKINGEFYIDSLINDSISLGLNCYFFEVDYYLCWGTPNDLKTFEYWQSCFHKWNSHPYNINNDNRIPNKSKRAIEESFVIFNDK